MKQQAEVSKALTQRADANSQVDVVGSALLAALVSDVLLLSSDVDERSSEAVEEVEEDVEVEEESVGEVFELVEVEEVEDVLEVGLVVDEPKVGVNENEIAVEDAGSVGVSENERDEAEESARSAGEVVPEVEGGDVLDDEEDEEEVLEEEEVEELEEEEDVDDDEVVLDVVPDVELVEPD